MATRNSRTPDQIRRDIESHREQLARSVEVLRGEVARATDIASKLNANLPVVAAGALGAGFVLFGGIGATMRLLARRSREGDIVARFGHFEVVDRS
jgi:Protein of unknown function (DUF3618)